MATCTRPRSRRIHHLRPRRTPSVVLRDRAGALYHARASKADLLEEQGPADSRTARNERVPKPAQPGDAGGKLAIDVNPTVGLVIFLLLYALLGAAFAFNVWGVSDRSAAAYRGMPWLLRQIGRDNPATWRSGGVVMAVFGVAMVAGILVLATWHPLAISINVAIAVLIAVAIVSTLMLVRSRWRTHPPEPPEGR